MFCLQSAFIWESLQWTRKLLFLSIISIFIWKSIWGKKFNWRQKVLLKRFVSDWFFWFGLTSKWERLQWTWKPSVSSTVVIFIWLNFSPRIDFYTVMLSVKKKFSCVTTVSIDLRKWIEYTKFRPSLLTIPSARLFSPPIDFHMAKAYSEHGSFSSRLF